MERWLLRYARLWLIAAEARVELLLIRWVSRLLTLLALLIGGIGVLIFLSLAFYSWKAPVWGAPLTFLTLAGLWLLGITAVGWFLPRSIHRFLPLHSATYRLRLARAGMRLIEEELESPPRPAAPPKGIPTWLLAYFWNWGKRWLLRRLKQWLLS